MRFDYGTFDQYSAKIYDVGVSWLSAAAREDGKLFAAVGATRILSVGSDGWQSVSSPPGCGPTRVLFFRGDRIRYSMHNSFHYSDEQMMRDVPFDEPVVDAAEDSDGTFWVLTERYLYHVRNGEKENTNDAPPDARRIAVRDGEVFCACAHGLFVKKGKRRHWAEMTSEWSGLVSDDVRCVQLDELGFVWIGTGKGVCVWDNKNEWKTPENTSNLPACAVNDMAFGADGAKYFAADTGVVMLKNGALRYFTYRRWLPSPRVLRLAVNRAGEILALTEKGASLITPRKITLEQKADYFDDQIEQYFLREDGWCVSRPLSKPGELDSGRLRATDNDGLYTGLYAAAQCFRWAVTKDEKALARARRAVDALLKLLDVTGIEGFPARAIRYSHEPDFGTGERQEWHYTDESRTVEWRGETSSDEITGHLYAYSVFYDLCADGEEKKKIADAVRKIVDHIMAHEWRLADADGTPTTWGNWAPESINGDGKWVFERGINSLEILSYLITARHVTGDEKYLQAFRSLARDHHYLLNVMNYKIRDAHISHIDDQLAFNAIYPLLEYADDPDLRAVILMGLADHREYERVERTPLYEFVYARFTGDGSGIADGARTLAQMPLDFVNYPAYNSHIPGLVWDHSPEKYGNPAHLARPLSREIAPVYGGAGNPLHCDAGSDSFIVAAENSGLFDKVSLKGHNSMHAQNPVIYLQPYWAGRYFGLLE